VAGNRSGVAANRTERADRPSRATGLRTRLVGLLPDNVAQDLRATRRAVGRSTAHARRLRPEPSFPPGPAGGNRLLVGPANFAGQGWAWARAAEAHLPDVGAVAMAIDTGRFDFPADYRVSPEHYRHPYWQLRQERYVVGTFTAVLVEALRPVLGPRYADDCSGDIRALRGAGVSVGLVAHGSDVRLPSRHAEREPGSPFRRRDELTLRLERQAARLGAVINDFSGPTFVSTPDLLIDVPHATWLPVVVDPDRWAGGQPALTLRKPVVLHVPSNPWLKGSDVVNNVASTLAARDLIEYRQLEAIPSADMPRVLADADIVIDQLRMGLYGVAACEAMAAGRVVVSYVGEHVRAHVRSSTGFDLPVIEADTTTLAEVLTSLVEDPESARERAARGVEFVRAMHDGRRSAEVLHPWLTDVSATDP